MIIYPKKLGIICLGLSLLSGGCMTMKQGPLQAGKVETQALESSNGLKDAPETQTESVTAKDQKDPAELNETPSALPAPVNPQLDRVIQRFQTGTRLLDKGEVDEARILFETLRDEYPEVSVFYLNLGVAYKRLERFEEAIQAYRQAISISDRNPNDGYAEAHYNLGILLREQGDFKGAEAVYLRAIDLAPAFQDAHFNLAVLYDLYLNEPAKAVRHYQAHMALTTGVDEEVNIWISALQKRLNETGVSQ